VKTETSSDGPYRRSRPARAHKTATVVAQEIIDEMGRNDFVPGVKLPVEREMLAKYGVGRGTLRESLRYLEMNGIITMKPGPGGGPAIGEPDSYDFAGTLGLFLQVNRTSFKAIVEVRKLLEPIIAGLAAEHATSETLDAIRQSVADMKRGLEDEEVFLQANERFHDTVALAAGNTVFELLIRSLHRITDGVPLGVAYPKSRRLAVLRAHQRIFKAIEAEDIDLARETMERHVVEFDRYLKKYYPTAYDKLLRWSDVSL